MNHNDLGFDFGQLLISLVFFKIIILGDIIAISSAIQNWLTFKEIFAVLISYFLKSKSFKGIV